MAMQGAEVIKEAEPFVLMTWNAGVWDAFANQRIELKHGQPWTGPYNKDTDIPAREAAQHPARQLPGAPAPLIL
ncbi:MAG: hypothetical protein ACI8RZ_002913 [Myxococcota bacterium]|jgi:hypothetical protein